MSFERAFAFVVGVEGAFTRNSHDPGNWTGGAEGVGILKGTKYGISAKSHPKLDIENLTLEQAKSIYRYNYWAPLGLDGRKWFQQLLMFDCAVNQGVQRANDFDSDVRTRDPLEYAIQYQQERACHYASLNSWKTFGRGWMRRLFRGFNEALKDESSSG